MRTIKFRGKLVHDYPTRELKKGYWVEGFYFEDLSNGEWKSFIREDLVNYEVEKNTAGQFTGLYDKNGNEIYEGDVIIEKLKRARIDGERLVVCFDDFEWQGKSVYDSITSLSLLSEYHTFEVIGNIHDNSELLKGGAE